MVTPQPQMVLLYQHQELPDLVRLGLAAHRLEVELLVHLRVAMDVMAASHTVIPKTLWPGCDSETRLRDFLSDGVHLRHPPVARPTGRDMLDHVLRVPADAGDDVRGRGILEVQPDEVQARLVGHDPAAMHR